MAKFLVKAAYTAEGVARRDQGRRVGPRRPRSPSSSRSSGGKVEAFYFAYGECDAYLIVDVADEATALALSLAVNASGAVTLELVPLITAADGRGDQEVGRLPGAGRMNRTPAAPRHRVPARTSPASR